MGISTSLVNCLLIAMPSMDDTNFKRAVVIICEHYEEGTVGLIINRPSDLCLSLVFEQLQIKPNRLEQNNQPLLFGGPLQPERGFVIHRPCGDWRSSLFLKDNITVTTSNDIIRAIATDTGPTDVLITLGYSGWDRKQLEEEVRQGSWLICPLQDDLIANLLYHVPFTKRWEHALKSMGVEINQLASFTGNA